MKRSRSKKRRGLQIPLFVKKLMQIMESHLTQDIISWTTTGDSFIIKSITKFTQQVLPIYWKHRNFSSFIRQLNMYGFKKTRHPDGENVYTNEDFKAGSRQLLKNIERKMPEQKEEVIMAYNGSILRNEGVTVKEINDLKGRQKKLEEMCKHFIFENQRLIEENKNLVHKMEQQSTEKEERLQQFLYCLVTQNRTREISAPEQGPKLSITNSQYDLSLEQPKKQQQQASNIQNVSTEADQSSHIKRVKVLLQQIYFRRNSKFSENITHINPPKKEQPYFHLDEMKSELIDMPNEDQFKNQQFLSINDFINADDQDYNIDLSASP